MTACF